MGELPYCHRILDIRHLDPFFRALFCNRYQYQYEMQQKGLYLILLLSLSACQKDFVFLTAEDKLVDKIWYLEKISTPAGSLTYTGQPTFSFHLTKSSRFYNDSDGIIGTYYIDEQPLVTSLQITSNGRLIEAFLLRQVESDYVVMEYSKNNITNTLYFSLRP